MVLEKILPALLIAAAIGSPVLAFLMIALPWLADRRADAILRKLDDN